MAARKIVQAGRKAKRRNTGPTLTLGTIKVVHDYDGNMVADVTVRGADLLGLDMTVDCVNAQPGDRCVIQEQAHHAMVTGILAKPGAITPGLRSPLFTWTSAWAGNPGSEPSTGYVEKQQTISLPATTTLLCEAGAAIAGTGEYALAFDFQQDGVRKAYVAATSPQKNGGTLRWTMSKTVGLPPGRYEVILTSFHWGSVEIIGIDSSGNSKRWIDPSINTEPVPRYAKITAL